MSPGRLITALWDGPPEPAGWGRTWYLPDDFYYSDLPDFPVSLACRVTGRTAARWADYYRLFALAGLPDREGALPDSPDEREALVDVFFDVYDREGYGDGMPPSPDLTVPLDLFAGDVHLLAQSNGVPGCLSLTPEGFSALQDVWERNKLPRNLYYPANEQRLIMEPVELLGGVVNWPQRYSPLRWAKRHEQSSVATPALSEEDQRKRFIDACRRFSQALSLRTLQIADNETRDAAEELAQLERVSREIYPILEREAKRGGAST